MPRGKRKTALESIADQLTQLDTQIQEAQEKELLELKKKQELDVLYSKIQASGKTVEEVFEAIQK